MGLLHGTEVFIGIEYQLTPLLKIEYFALRLTAAYDANETTD